ncbi:MAG: 50S ribosomal protein L9 [Patescibacteria group bacterium]
MKLILLTDVKKVGQRGTLVSVADGYAQNVLIPKKLALPATAENIRKFEKQQQSMKEKVAMDATLAKKALAGIDGKEIGMQARANEKGTLFESIHTKQVATAIQKELGVNVSEDSVMLVGGVIKTLGSHRVEVKVQEAFAELSVLVEAKKI